MHDTGQSLIFNRHDFCCIKCLRLAFGDDHRNRFADVARLVVRQQQVRSNKDLAAAWPLQLHVVFGLRKGIVLNCAKTIGKAISARKHAQNTRHPSGTGAIDPHDPRVGIRRTDHCRIGLSRKAEVVAELSTAR